MRPKSFSFRRNLLTVGLVSFVGLGFIVLSLALGGGLPTGASSYTAKALLPSSSSLARKARVTIAGVQVGQVTKVTRQGVGAIVELKITDDRVTPLPSDSRGQLRMRTAVGENYLEIVPGTSRTPLGKDGVLTEGKADDYVDVDQVLSVLRGKSREGARRLIQGVAHGVDGRGDELNQVVVGAAGFLRDGSTLVNVLADDRRQTGRLIDGLGSVSAAIGERDGAITKLATGGLTTLQALADRDDALRDVIKVVPSTLTQVKQTTGTLRSVSATATPVLRNVSEALREVRPAVRTLQPAATEGRRLLAEVSRAAPPLQNTLAKARSLSTPLATALPSLQKVICQVRPMVHYIAPYTEDVMSLLVGLGSAANSYDATGHLLRLIPIVDENSLVGLPENVSKAAHTLLRAGVLGESLGIDYDPFPKPGQIGKTVADKKDPILGPSEVPRKYTYPRIMADC
ncbi:MAG: hypothetical protein JWO02_1859 [Solirubrobacterales bacterium]|nr:hypothetical protein [Solirubrobacterales bacterium]